MPSVQGDYSSMVDGSPCPHSPGSGGATRMDVMLCTSPAATAGTSRELLCTWYWTFGESTPVLHWLTGSHSSWVRGIIHCWLFTCVCSVLGGNFLNQSRKWPILHLMNNDELCVKNSNKYIYIYTYMYTQSLYLWHLNEIMLSQYNHIITACVTGYHRL